MREREDTSMLNEEEEEEDAERDVKVLGMIDISIRSPCDEGCFEEFELGLRLRISDADKRGFL